MPNFIFNTVHSIRFSKIAMQLILLCFFNITFAQYNTLSIKKDTIIKAAPINVTAEDIASSRLKESKILLENNHTIHSQNTIFNLIYAEIQKVSSLSNQGIDYKGFTREIDILMQWKNFAVDGITTNKHNVQSSRNLTTTTILLNELYRRTNNQLEKIKSNNKELGDIQNRLDSLAANKVLYIIPKDSVAKMNYSQKLIFLTDDILATNTILKNAIDSIQSLEIKGSIFKFNLESDIEKIDLMRKIQSENYYTKKYPVIALNNPNSVDFIESVQYSAKKGYLVLSFYIINHIPAIILLILCIVGIGLYLRVLKQKYIRANLYQDFKYPIQILNQPFLIATLITITVCQLFIQSPPFIFTAILWLIASTALTIIILKSKSKTTLKTWLTYLTLIILVIIDNLLLVKTTPETLLVFGIGLSATIYGINRIRNKDRNRIFNAPTFWIISLMLFFEIFGLVFLLNGNYNISKIFTSVGIITILIGYLSIYTFQFILDIIAFSEYLIEKDTKVHIDTTIKENHSVTKSYFIIFAIAWIIIINRNTYSFENFIDPFLVAFSEEQTIGTFTFSYNSFLIFFVVLIISSFISKLVTFLTYENNSRIGTEKSNTIGSWVLLIRIAIFSLGIIIAFASTGIPMDRIGIIISILGVGIGFGLQGLVNNLVSGLIIAFEKPVNIDDIIEIGGKSGTMKSIGIRSSVVTTWDGADIIIPNGDILNQQMTNWTMGSSKRRFEIKVGVAYGTDLKLAKSIIKDITKSNKLILKNPETVIWLTQFGDSSIDFVIKFWVAHFNYGNDVKSDLIMAIDEAFKSNGITIPFPQRDLNIKTDAKKSKEIEE